MTAHLDSDQSALLGELKQSLKTRSARRRKRVFAAMVAGLAVAAVASGAALSATVLDAPTPAYAIDETAGDITITLRSLTDAAGLQAALAERGLNAVVVFDGSEAPEGTVAVVEIDENSLPVPHAADDDELSDECGEGPVPSLSVENDRAVITIPAGALPEGTPFAITATPQGVPNEFTALNLSWMRQGSLPRCVLTVSIDKPGGEMPPTSP